MVYYKGHMFVPYPNRNIPGYTCLSHREPPRRFETRGAIKGLSFVDRADPCRKAYEAWQAHRRVCDSCGPNHNAHAGRVDIGVNQ